MDIEKMTVRVQKSLNEAYQIAVKKHNQQVDVIHLFSALVNQEDGLIPNILEKIEPKGIPPSSLMLSGFIFSISIF